MHDDPTKFCRVCGLEQPYSQYGESGTTPTYEICDCCGVEFGYEDSTVDSAYLFHEKWVSNGKKWFMPELKPANWLWNTQKKKIPPNFNNYYNSK